MIYELFSQRKRRLARSGESDVYQYSDVSQKLKVQVQQILSDAMGPQYIRGAYDTRRPSDNAAAWRLIERTLCRENGVHSLARGSTEAEQVLQYVADASCDEFLDVVELCARYIDKVQGSYSDYDRQSRGIDQEADEAIKELNFRFRDSGFGYQYENGQLIRVDTDYTHEEIVKPALSLLSTPEFAGPEAEFLRAHRHYRSGENEQAVVEAGKAFESTLKAVCDIRGWQYEKGARATDLLKLIRRQGLWPDYLDASFDQLLATLASGLPRVRNEEGAHGQGARVRVVPDHVAAYALHLAAAKIRLVAEAARA